MQSVVTRASSLVFGLTLPLRALGVILSSPVLIFWSVLPVALTIGIYSWIITRLKTYVHETTFAWLSSHGISAHGFLSGIILVASWCILLLIGALTFSFIAGIVASPFNDFLAEKTEARSNPPLPQIRKVSFAAKTRIILIDLAKTFAAALIALMALVFSWVPILNIVAFAIAFLLMTFQFISYPQTRRGEGMGAGFRFLLNHPFACLGFGASCSALFALPFVSAMSLPLAVVGGTLLYARAGARRSLAFPPLR